MDQLRRTLSLGPRRRKKENANSEGSGGGGSSKPHQWQEDERKVREGMCSFQVKYLGCLEVFESRGMLVCEDAAKLLRSQCKGKYQRVVLYVSGDALRVVEEISKGLIVDQTIEKVSFCAPDRNHEKGFAYICRDGTTRRWMCHGFLALKESGERLSHAVGCAFAVCLEKKQKRERDAVQVTFTEDRTAFTRIGSFKQTTLTERMVDPQAAILTEPTAVSKVPVAVDGAAARERPQTTADAFARLGSFRDFPKLASTTSPFKRQLSLRLNELPSTLDRQQQDADVRCKKDGMTHGDARSTVQLASVATGRPHSASGSSHYPQASVLVSIPPMTLEDVTFDPISEMCLQLTKELSSLTTGKDLGVAVTQQQQTLPPTSEYFTDATKLQIEQPRRMSASMLPSSEQQRYHGSAQSSESALLLPEARMRTSATVHVTATSNATAYSDSWPGIAVPSSATATAIKQQYVGYSVAASSVGGFPLASDHGLTTNNRDPFDTTWALRAATVSTNPFVSQQQPQQRYSHNANRHAAMAKTFEMKL